MIYFVMLEGGALANYRPRCGAEENPSTLVGRVVEAVGSTPAGHAVLVRGMVVEVLYAREEDE